MSLELLREIEQAEAKAEEARAIAQKEARDMTQSVAEACATQERAAMLEHRALTQRILEEAKTTAQRRIAEMDSEQRQQREQIVASAREKIDAAVERIVERIVRDGHC